MRFASQSGSATSSSWRHDKTLNLADYLVYRHVRDGSGDQIALFYGDHGLTYSWLEERISKGATVLRQCGVKPGSLVLLLMPDTPSFVTILFACLQLGGIAMPVNPSLSPEDVSHIVDKAGAKIGFLDEKFADKFRSLASRMNNLVVVGDLVERSAEFETQVTHVQRTDKFHAVQDAIAYCLFSSGTTGAPKGIPHRHTDILECIEAYSIPVLGMSSQDRVLAVPKLTFGYGLGGNLFSSLYVGGSSILIPEPSSREAMVHAAEKYNPTLFLGQPRLISDLLAGPLPPSFHRIRLAVTAGEVLVPALHKKWTAAHDIELLDGFGSTEVGHVFISNRPGDVRPGSAGRVLDGFQVKILDDSGNPVGPNTVGHLWVTGPSLSSGYWNDPERSHQYFQAGWARTGDLFRSDEEGYLYACGRSDEMIKAGCGQWVSPFEIEALLSEDSSVLECAVVGCSDEHGLIQPKAYVVLRPGNRPNLEIEKRLRLAVAQRWPELPYKHLSSVEFSSSLPRSATGKLQRFLLGPTTLTEFSYDC